MDFNKGEAVLFTGIEQEGPNKGKDTLFVVGDVPYHHILNKLNELDYAYVYFGAGGTFEYNAETILRIAALPRRFYNPLYVTIESTKFDKDLMEKLANKVDKIFWVIPYIWHSEVLTEGYETLMSLVADSKDLRRFGTRIFVKVDCLKTVVISPFRELYVNSYFEGYSEDKVLGRY